MPMMMSPMGFAAIAAFHSHWTAADVALFEELVEEDDVEIMAWALGTEAIPAKYAGPMMDAMRKLDYVEIPR